MEKKIAILGGTFNPIHYGHLRTAEEVRELCGLESIFFVPVNIPPHKYNQKLTLPEHRLKMVELAIKDNPFFILSDIEIKRGGISYTIDTVKELTEKGYRVSIITGSDQFNAIATWRSYTELFQHADFVVVKRAGYRVKKLEECLPVELAEKFWYDKSIDAYMNSFDHRVTYIDTTLLDISSSDIRRRIKQGLSVRYLLPPEVEEYIKTNRLYRD